MLNNAVWIDKPGEPPRIDSAPIPDPAAGQVLIRTAAVAVQPGEWKIQAGLIPVPLTYPTIIGLSLSGVIVKVGPGVTRFAPGDRVACNTSGVLRNDPQFGAYQNFALAPQELTAKIGNTPFEEAASISTAYGAFSALFLHLGLDRPPTSGAAAPTKTRPDGRAERVLVWGVSSSFGLMAAQLARLAGYGVVGVASAARHGDAVVAAGLPPPFDREGRGVVGELVAVGPYKAVLAAADSAPDQVKIGEVIGHFGGGRFLSTMGVRDGVKLPPGVSGFFKQFLDDFLANPEFAKWVWWEYLEAAFADGRLKSVPLEVKRGLSKVPEAWDILREGKTGGKRLIIVPDEE